MLLFGLLTVLFIDAQNSDTALYRKIKESVNSHKVNLDNTVRFIEDNCVDNDQKNLALKPIFEKYNWAFDLFSKLNPNNIDLDKAYILADKLQDASNEINYSSKYGLLKKYSSEYCKKF